MTFVLSEKEKTVAWRAVRTAAGLCTRVQSNMIDADSLDKLDRSPVTVADFAAQATICRTLMESFPDDAIMAEEDSSLLRSPEKRAVLESVTQIVRDVFTDAMPAEVMGWIDRGCFRDEKIPDRFWTLDPVDGTKGFLRGEQYTVALSLVVEGRVRLGLMACPNLSIDGGHVARGTGIIFGAVLGEGAWAAPLEGWAPVPIRVSSESDPASMVMAESFAHADHSQHARVARKLGILRAPVRIDSQAKYGLLAAGLAQVYLRLPQRNRHDYREKIWDHAAGALVAEEAGGQVTDAAGHPLDFTRGTRLEVNTGLVVTNGVLHDRILEIVSASADRQPA